jgi:hypothetical protein
MQSTLNKYLPNDITNIILEFHYKSMFSKVLKELNKSIFIYNRILDHINEDELKLTFYMCAMSHVRFSDYRNDDDDEDIKSTALMSRTRFSNYEDDESESDESESDEDA